MKTSVVVALTLSLMVCKDSLSEIADDRVDERVPGRPENVEATSSDQAVTLEWTNPSDADFSHVEIEWSSDVEGAKLGTPTSSHSVSGDSGARLMRTIEDLTNGALYLFRIRAATQNGNHSDAVERSVTPEDTEPPQLVSDVFNLPEDGQIELRWKNPLDADFDHIEIEWGLSGSTDVQSRTIEDSRGLPGGKHEHIIDGLISGREYTIAIIAFDRSGLSSRMMVRATPIGDGHLAVSELGIERGSEEGTISLTWVNPEASAFVRIVGSLVRIEVSWRLQSNEGQSMSATTTGERYVIRDLTPGVLYTINVTAIYSGGERIARGGDGTATDLPPADVSGVGAADGAGDGEIILSWTNPDVADFDHVEIGWKPLGAGHGSQPVEVAGTAGATSTHTVTGLTRETEYTFTLISVDNRDNRAPSPHPTVIHEAPDHGPGPVLNLIATPDPNIAGKITLSWTNPDDPDFNGASVQHGLVGMNVLDTKGISSLLPGRTGNFDIEELTPHQGYFFVVTSRDGHGKLGKPVRVEATTLDPDPPEVTMAMATTGGAQGEIDLSWVNPTNEDFAGVSITWTPAHGETQPVMITGGAGESGARTIIGLTANTEYTFTLVVVDDGGNRSDGVEAVATTPVTVAQATLSVTDSTVTEEAADGTNGRAAVFTLALTNLPTSGADDVSVFFTMSGFAGTIGSENTRETRLFTVATTTGSNVGVGPFIDGATGAGRIELSQPEIDGDIAASGSATAIFQIMLENDDGNVVNETITLNIDCVARSRIGAGQAGCASVGTTLLVDSDAVGGTNPASVTVIDDEWAAIPGNRWMSRSNIVGAAPSFLDVVWTGSQLVAVGSGGTIVTSPDGIIWTSRTSRTPDNLWSVTWTGSQLVAVGSDGTIVTSPDGITWTSRTSGTNMFLRDVVWTGSRIVVVSNGGAILTSSNGSRWAPQNSGVTQNLNGVVWTGSQLVAVGSGGTIVTSPDGAIWTSRTSGTSQQLNGIAWTGSQLVAVGKPASGSQNGQGAIVTSFDGIRWTPRISGTGKDLNDVVWANNQLVAVGAVGVILISPNGVTWTPRDSGTNQQLNGIAWTGSQLVVASDATTILTSP